MEEALNLKDGKFKFAGVTDGMLDRPLRELVDEKRIERVKPMYHHFLVFDDYEYCDVSEARYRNEFDALHHMWGESEMVEQLGNFIGCSFDGRTYLWEDFVDYFGYGCHYVCTDENGAEQDNLESPDATMNVFIVSHFKIEPNAGKKVKYHLEVVEPYNNGRRYKLASPFDMSITEEVAMEIAKTHKAPGFWSRDQHDWSTCPVNVRVIKSEEI